MKIKEKKLNDVLVFELKGDFIGGPDSTAFHDKINKAIQDGWKKIVVNLGDVKWMDSTGLGVMMAAYTSVKKVEGDIKLVKANKKIENLLIITKLMSVLKNYNSEAEAIAYFNA